MKILRKYFLLLIFVFTSFSIFACEIDFEITSAKKEIYKKGDEITLKIKVTLIHRNCNIGIKDSDFKQEGVKIKSATDWKEISPGVWERKIKINIIDTTNDKATLSLTRKCNKDGGFGTISFPLIKKPE